MDKKESLKSLLKNISTLSEKVFSIKESIASLASEDAKGGQVEQLTDEQKAEAAKKAEEEAKAAEVAAEATAKLAQEEKEKAEAMEKEKAEATKKEIEEAAAKKLEQEKAEAAAKDKELADAKAAKELEEAEAAKKAKAEKVDKYNKAMCSEDIADLGFAEAEAELAAKHSYVELVKVLASLTKEVVSLKEEKAKAEASKTADSRYRELVELGVAFSGEKGEAQKVKLKDMDEKAFASYKEMALHMKEAVDKGEALTPEAIKKAKASLSEFSISVKLEEENLASKYAKL